ncbi:MAG: zinc ribbon domain-containing protein, partial [Anaerolineaceae bacterium]
MPTTQKFCRSCGAQVNPGARFCRRCGAQLAAATSSSPPTLHRSAGRIPHRALYGGALAAAIVVAVIAVGAVVLRGGDGSQPANEPEDERPESATIVLEPAAPGAVDKTTGLPLRPHVRLEHPEGATADIPGGSALYGDGMDLRRVDLAPDPLWDYGGKGWEFVSSVGIPIQGRAVLDLPAGTSGSRPIVRTSLGLWTELPSESVKLANGQPGVRVTVTNVPAPWTFAIATPRPDALELTAEEQGDLRLEGLYFTDRTSWEREMVAWLKTDPLARSMDGPRYVAIPPRAETPSETYDRLRSQVRFTLKVFAAARAGLTADVTLAPSLAPIPGLQLTSDGLWAAGVQRLAAVKENWLAFRSTVPNLDQQSPNYVLAIVAVDQWIETAMFDYTPWGIDLVKTLLDTGGLKGFDIRVLKPYGELKWTDVT